MTKGELLRLLEPFTPEVEITVMSPEGITVDIKKLGHQANIKGSGEVTMIPMGSHLPKEGWADIRMTKVKYNLRRSPWRLFGRGMRVNGEGD